MNRLQQLLQAAKLLYGLDHFECKQVAGHDGGRNLVYVCLLNEEKKYVLRISALGDRTEEDYLAETEFVRYLAANHAPVADVLPSIHGRLVEAVRQEGRVCYVCLFAYAKGILLAENGYRYREGAPLEEYFYNTGKALGAIHRLSKAFVPSHRRTHYAEKYNMATIHRLIPESFAALKSAIARRLERFAALPTDAGCYGLVHFDFSDGNYHIDMNTGTITVFDFDNCLYGWYLFDLANLWVHGEGWCRCMQDAGKRKAFMTYYFDAVLRGYRSETEVSENLLEQLPLFIDMVLIENVVDAFECCLREGEEVDEEDLAVAARCLIQEIPCAGIVEA